MHLTDIIAAEETDGAERYHVDLPKYAGPMDLLLTLIEREELEITEISLAQVTDQYLEYLEALQQISPDDLTEFLAVAAKLILLKSQILLPKPPPSIIEDEEESTDDLLQQLKDYKRFKQLAQELNALQKTGRRNFIRLAPPPKIEAKLDLGDVDAHDLLTAVRRALVVKPELSNVDTVVSREVITIGQKIQTIRHRLNTNERVSFTDLLTASCSRMEIIVTLLAVLELIKQGVIDIDQPQSFGEISIIKKENTALTDSDWVQLSQIEDVS